ncbi:MarR family winged helix-turn-helix transcriptional regulator [Neisseria sp. CCUG17229]|uniref:MarR family winged helix-turn-helix transcriptional regulator n=1 Tax=Neisseria sp. CCUG17229 TaxID=3392036 RepID=UPI003A0FE5A7
MRTFPPNALEQIAELSTQMLAGYERFAKAHHISSNELDILYTLWVEGACSQARIAEKCLLAKQTVNTLCKKYEAQGLLTGHVSEQDKREKVMALTEQGRAFAEPIVGVLLTRENSAVAAFGQARIDFLLSELQALKSVVETNLEQDS